MGIKLLRITLPSLLLFSCGELPIQPRVTLQMVEVHKEQSTGVHSKREEIITSPERWDSVWKEIVSNRSPKPTRPEVNFSSDVLVFVARGETGDACQHMAINRIEAQNGQLDVFVDDTRAPMSCTCPPMTVQPVHVVAIPRVAQAATFHYRSITVGNECR